MRMRMLCWPFLAGLLLLGGAAHAGQPMTVAIAIQVSGSITSISPTSCSVTAGPGGSVCQFTATTSPAGLAVTWTFGGGTDDAKFVLTPAGALSAGTGAGPGNYVVKITATTP